MKIVFSILPAACLIIIWATISSAQTDPADIQFTSSPNPVGSGARALGVGGAFIALADDATAASWNPGALVQLGSYEMSLVINGIHRIEENRFDPPELDGSTLSIGNDKESVSLEDINYASIAIPFNVAKYYHMVVSLNYQHLYDFSRDWDFPGTGRIVNPNDSDEVLSLAQYVEYRQKGALSALGLAYAIQPCPRFPEFSVGFTLNLWHEKMNSKWEENLRYVGLLKMTGPDFEFPIKSVRYEKRDKYSFNGFNANIGMLWDKNDVFKDGDQIKAGAVFKFPFRAHITHESITADDGYEGPKETTKEKLDMPMSYGLGLAYRFPDDWFKNRRYLSDVWISADLYRTHWEDFILIDSDGYEISPVTYESPRESGVDTTLQFRSGVEFRFDPKKTEYIVSDYILSLRAGMFYDPAPVKGGHDDYYGISLGGGVVRKEGWAFDIAYQFRYANNVGPIIPIYGHSEDVREHTVYASMIFYFGRPY